MRLYVSKHHEKQRVRSVNNARRHCSKNAPLAVERRTKCLQKRQIMV